MGEGKSRRSKRLGVIIVSMRAEFRPALPTSETHTCIPCPGPAVAPGAGCCLLRGGSCFASLAWEEEAGARPADTSSCAALARPVCGFGTEAGAK